MERYTGLNRLYILYHDKNVSDEKKQRIFEKLFEYNIDNIIAYINKF